MIEFGDWTYSDNKFFMILYVSELLSYVLIEVNRNCDIPKTIEHYKNLDNINKYLNGETI